jgi:hypothetical protein
MAEEKFAFFASWGKVRAMKTKRAGFIPWINGAGARSASGRGQAAGQALRRLVCCGVAAASAAGLAALSGCSKPPPPAPTGTSLMMGVRVQAPKLAWAFTNATPEVQEMVRTIRNSYRGGRFHKMVDQLQMLGSVPDLTPEQKKLVEDLIKEMGEIIAKNPNVPG